MKQQKLVPTLFAKHVVAGVLFALTSVSGQAKTVTTTTTTAGSVRSDVTTMTRAPIVPPTPPRNDEPSNRTTCEMNADCKGSGYQCVSHLNGEDATRNCTAVLNDGDACTRGTDECQNGSGCVPVDGTKDFVCRSCRDYVYNVRFKKMETAVKGVTSNREFLADNCAEYAVNANGFKEWGFNDVGKHYCEKFILPGQNAQCQSDCLEEVTAKCQERNPYCQCADGKATTTEKGREECRRRANGDGPATADCYSKLKLECNKLHCRP